MLLSLTTNSTERDAMKLDREFQYKLLNTLADTFPGMLSREEYTAVIDGKSEEDFAANVLYLEEHGLIQPGSCIVSIDGIYSFNSGALKITKKGLDFVSDDGGLSAILDVVNVKLHADTIRDLLEARLASADIPAEEKKTIIDHLKTLPAEGLKHLTTRLIDLGLDNLPAVLPLLRAQLSL
ncbi:hypothetical protein [Chromobacterium subtsugae]|uniref:hypothetical protein n=1 Tax=Chromobacterium subtsugae TaxID=251747 RepID=UPI000699B8BA|nr:hypothetical protein [Chromobacterium subtsugae]